MGSVKDLEILKIATLTSPGRARFNFTDRYSIFDWGEMPDHIDNKGCAIALMGAWFFEKLEDRGIPTHYRGLVDDGQVKTLDQIHKPVSTMEVELLRVIPPRVKGDGYDYSMYADEKVNFLIPLEVIYRNSLPSGSSVFKRLKEGHIQPGDLGLKEMPVPDQKLNEPIIDVSTKLEITDRYLLWNEAQRISGLKNKEIDALKQLTHLINDIITIAFSKIGLVNEDGKIEVGFDRRRRLMPVDVLGTLDECRFTMDGLPVSKEIARIFYRNTPWSRDVEEAKKKDRQNWKRICRSSPKPLPPELKSLISEIYCACTNEITEKEWFPNIPPLEILIEEVRKILR